MPIKTGVFSIGWVIKQLFYGCFGGIDKTTAPRYRGQLDAPLSSAFRPRPIVHRDVHGKVFNIEPIIQAVPEVWFCPALCLCVSSVLLAF